MLSSFKDIISKMAVLIIIGLTAIFFVQKKEITKLNNNLSIATNNLKCYQELNNELKDKGRTLQLRVDQLRNTNDSMISVVNDVKKKLKVKDNNLQQAQVINTEMKDTITKIITKDIDFKQDLKLNPLTTIIVERKDSILTTILDIKNQQILLVEETKEYRNKYKSWFQRLCKFDFKKDRVRKYQIHNSNPLIQVTDTRIIEIIK